MTISNRLRLMVARILVLAYSMEEIYKIFEVFEGFLKNAKESYFKESKDRPLILTEEGDKELKNALERFPSVYSAGVAGVKEKDFVYFLGQFLIITAMKMEGLEIQLPKAEFDDIKKIVTELMQIWGSMKQMNGHYLYLRFKGKDQKTVISTLIPLLEKSAKITKELSPIVVAK